ncbi:unnamed protein product [Adineta ricciae]|uniref:Uncharacterized protein n=1 Tax=Adineta ricciae TaxID=249248 RepID=A0A813MZA8_ADIRI|nr:unnamed protein product [Adineta ricciae]
MFFFLSCTLFSSNYVVIVDHAKDIYRTIERLLDRKSPLFRFTDDQFTSEQISGKNRDHICEILTENFERIRLCLGVKTLDGYYNNSLSDSQLYTPYPPNFMHSTESLNLISSNSNRAFTDLNLRMSKRSINSTTPMFKINYALVNRVVLNWPLLFTHIIAQLKSSIIYHFVTLRFEFQSNSSTSLTDEERLAVGRLIELLPPFFNEKK